MFQLCGSAACMRARAGGAVVQLEGVTICTPTFSRTLVDDLDLALPPGGSLLVMGPSGCGKTSLLRAIGGLWSSGTGTITRPSLADLRVRPPTRQPYLYACATCTCCYTTIITPCFK